MRHRILVSRGAYAVPAAVETLEVVVLAKTQRRVLSS
jgi:hypothetical protein